MTLFSRLFKRGDDANLASDTRVMASETTKTVERVREKREKALAENPNFPFSGFPTQAHPRKLPKVNHGE